VCFQGHDSTCSESPARKHFRNLFELRLIVGSYLCKNPKIAAVSAAACLQQGLHNEGFELSMVDGKRTYDLSLDLLDPKLVKYQFQMSTITAGFVAAEYFTRYPGRFYSMHLQDINMKVPAAEGASPRQRYPQVAMGKGSIDWVKTFTAAKIGGVKN